MWYTQVLDCYKSPTSELEVDDEQLTRLDKEGFQDTSSPPPSGISKLGLYHWTQSSHAENGDILDQSRFKRDRGDRYGPKGADIEMAMI